MAPDKHRRTLTEESPHLSRLKDRFMRFWPNLTLKLINLETEHLKTDEKVLVVGSGRIPKIGGPHVINTDIRPFDSVSVVSRAEWLPFADASFDILFCHQVLEHIADTAAVIDEMHRVVRPCGKVIVTVPFYFPFHASPHDYHRWTVPGLRFSFRRFEEIDAGMYVGPVSAILQGMQHFLGVLVPGFYPSYVLQGIAGYLLWPFKYFDLLVSRLPNAVHFAGSIYFVGRRPQQVS